MANTWLPTSLLDHFSALQFGDEAASHVADVAQQEASAQALTTLPSLQDLTPWDAPPPRSQSSITAHDDYANEPKQQAQPPIELPSLESLTPWQVPVSAAPSSTDTSSAATETSSADVQVPPDQTAGAGPSSPSAPAVAASGSVDTSSPDAFLSTLHPYAQQAEAKTGVPASVLTAIAANESGYGKYPAGGVQGNNNFFGIKGKEPGSWSSFASPQEGLDWVANMFATDPRYARAYANKDNADAFVQELANAGYIQPDESGAWIKQVQALSKQAQAMAPVARAEAPQQTAAVDQAALDDPDKWALCGPVAAVLAAASHGKDWTVAQAKGIATKLGLWDAGNGMHGLQSEVDLLKQAGVDASTGAADETRLAKDALSGNTPIVSTDGHYFVLQGYDPQTGKFDTGTTGSDKIFKGGSRWLTLGEMQNLAGTIQGAAYMDNPASPTPPTDWRQGSGPAPTEGKAAGLGGTQADQPLDVPADDSTYGPFDPPGYGQKTVSDSVTSSQLGSDNPDQPSGLSQTPVQSATPTFTPPQVDENAGAGVGPDQVYQPPPENPLQWAGRGIGDLSNGLAGGLNRASDTLTGGLNQGADQLATDPNTGEVVQGPGGFLQAGHNVARAIGDSPLIGAADANASWDRMGEIDRFATDQGYYSAIDPRFIKDYPDLAREHGQMVMSVSGGMAGTAPELHGAVPAHLGGPGAAPLPNPIRRVGEAIGGLRDLATTGGAPVAGVVPPDIASRQPLRLPDDPAFDAAAMKTPGVIVSERGVELDAQRFQKPEQAGADVVRGGVHYMPESQVREYNRPADAPVGGPQEVVGPTILRQPLVLPDQHGFATPADLALNTLTGQTDYARSIRIGIANAIYPDAGSPAFEQRIGEQLIHLGADPAPAGAIARASELRGNRKDATLSATNAIVETAGADAARAAGYDSIITYMPGSRVREILDLRENRYPTPEGGYSVRPEFNPALAAEADRLSTGRQGQGTPGLGVVPTDRYYHGTGSGYDTPNPAHFDDGGLFGPAYYLTDNPEVSGTGDQRRPGYAEARGRQGIWTTDNRWLADNVTDLSDKLAAAQARLRESVVPLAERRLKEQQIRDYSDALARTGSNVRAVDVPQGLNLLDADVPVPADDLRTIAVAAPPGSQLAQLVPRWEQSGAIDHIDGNTVWKTLSRDLGPHDANQVLAAAGYDGVKYAGGRRVPMRDEAGNSIEHQAVAIFGESLPKITNATSGRPGGLLPAPDLTSTGQRLAGQAVGGAISGGYSASQQEGATPQSVLGGAALGAAGGVVRGAVGRRGAGQAIANAVQRAGEAIPPSEEPKPPTLPRTPPIPDGARPITLTPEQEAARLRLDKFPPELRDTLQKAAEGVDYGREQRRGVVPDEVSAGLADDLGRSVERWIREGKAGKSYNAEETRALRNAVTTQAGVVNDLARRVAEAQQSGGLTDALLAEAHREGQKLGALTTVAEGARAEWGRAGRAYQAATKMVDLPPTQAAERIFRKFGGGAEGRQRAVDALTEYNRLLQDGADPIQLAKYWANVEKGPPKIQDWFTALRYNSMLSGPRTFEVNAVGNGLEIPWRLGRDTLASTIRGRPGEMGPELAGTWVGMQRGAHAFMETLAHGITTEQALAGDLPHALADRVKNRVGKGAATALELPGRILGASDQFARQTAYGLELGRAAAVQASKDGFRGDAWKGRVADLLATPSEKMMARSLEVSKRMTYQNDMGGVGNWMQAGRRHAPVVSNIVLPFLKTVYNITARGIDRSPLGIVGTGIDVARGAYGKDLKGAIAGAHPENKALVPLGERLGDNVIGGLAGLWFVGQAFQGNVTGAGPDDPGKADILRAQGWQPYSVKVGDKWVSYSNWGPVALPLSMAAATAEGQKYAKAGDSGGQIALDTFERFAKLATEQSYLQAIGGVYKSISDPQRYGTQWLTDFVGSLVPYGAALNTVGQASDPYVHRPDKIDIGQALENRLPGLRANVPVAQDVLGQPVQNPAQGAAAFQPLRVNPQKSSAVLSAFQDAGVNIPRPGPTLSLGQGAEIPLSGAEQLRWQRLRGDILTTQTQKILANPRWATFTPAQREAVLKDVLNESHDAANSQIIAAIGGVTEVRKRLAKAS